jgi:hypothetical protein
MASPACEIGELKDAEGVRLAVGIDGDLVTIGMGRGFDWALNADQRKDFALLFHEAERQAEARAGPGCICGQTEAGCAEAGRRGDG